MTSAESLVMTALAAAYPLQDDLAEILREWEVLPYLQDGRLVGAACMKGSEFHCITTDGFRLRRAAMREFLTPLYQRHNCLTTRVQHSDVANQRFNYAFGFRRTWSDHMFHYFLMADLPFSREKI